MDIMREGDDATSNVGVVPMTETTLISVEDKEKIRKLYQAAQGILSGKIIKVVVDGQEKALDPLNLPVRDVLYLLESSSVTFRTSEEYGDKVVLLSTSNLKTEPPAPFVRAIKDTKHTEELLAALEKSCKQVPFMVNDPLGEISVSLMGKGESTVGLCYYIEVLNRATDKTIRLWFEMFLNGSAVEDQSHKDNIIRRCNPGVYSWFNSLIHSLDPMCRIVDTSWKRQVD